MEKKVFNGFDLKLDALRDKITWVERLTWAVLSGVLLTLVAFIIKTILGP